MPASSEADGDTLAQDAVVSWSVDPTDTLAGRLCVYALVGFAGGFVLLFAGVVALFVAVSVINGAYGALALFVLLALVGGPISAVALVPFLDADQRPPLPGPLGRVDTSALHPLVLAGSALTGAVVIAAPFTLGSSLGHLPALALAFLALLGLNVAAPEGQVDRDAGTLTVYDRTHALADLTSAPTYAFAGLVLVRARFVTQPGGRDAPWVVAMPATVYDEVADAFERGVRADPDAADPTSNGERLALFGAGAGAFTLAAFLWYVAWTSTTDGASILYWVGSLPALFGAFFVALGFRR